MSPVAIALVALAPLIALPLIGTLVCLMLSLVGGWRRLAARYPATRPPHGRRFAWQSASVGPVRYNNALIVHVAEDGLGFSVPFFLRPGHAPLFIPWSAVSRREKVKFLWHERVRLEIGSPAIARIHLNPEVLDAAPVTAKGGAR